MISFKNLRITFVLILSTFILSSCNGKLPGGDARKYPDDPKLRVKKNIEEGRGFRLNESIGKSFRSGVFEFASSNELWRASLDVIDFMPLSSVNYSGGMIITDWYSENNNPKKSIKISIRFLTNEVRSDALEIKIFNRTCNNSSFDCKFTDSSEVLVAELKKEILKKATIYNKEDKEKIKKKK